MSSHEVISTVLLSVRIGVLATLINLPIALFLMYIMTRHNFRGKGFLDGIINLPLVMPPVTTGYVLLLILGKKGLIGGVLFSLFGIRIAFTSAAAVIASMVVSFPLITRSIRISMEMIDTRLENVARTLGAGRKDVFLRITLPLVMPGVINGMILGFARSLGEFGATMIFAGNILGKTRTIPLSVYSFLQIPGKEREAAFMVGISVIISFVAMFLSHRFTARGVGGSKGAAS